jgi:protocatechuate 3,4-dioxygenase alpha subunit
MSKITTSQTIGPFSHEAWQWAVDATSTLETSAPTVTIKGVIYDGDGKAIDDAMIEAWLPDGAAAETAQAVPGFRRVPSGADGGFSMRVSMPKPATAGEPAMFVTVFARGLVKHQFTAVFLEDDTGLAGSAILNQVPAERRATLIARKEADGQYRWDIWMQTDKETVFFDYV